MGVYIKDMEMPINPDMAPTAVWVYPNGYAVVFKDNGKMQQYTQAVPVPPHGRLVDADAFLSTIRPICDEDAYSACTFETVKGLMIEHINDAPTIIPA